MNPNDIKPLLETKPFVKFYLYLTDGTCFEVSDPSQVSFSQSDLLVHDAKGRRSFIALAHVVSIGFPPSGSDPFFLRGPS